MIIRKIKQFFKETWGIYAFLVWLMALSSTLLYITEDKLLAIKVCLVVGVIIYTVIGYIAIEKFLEKADKKHQEMQDRMVKKLKEENKYYVDLVNKQTEKTINELKDNTFINKDTSCENLISFNYNKDWVCSNRITGKPDSFTIASCLLYSIISKPLIHHTNTRDNFNINLHIAMNCAFEIISEPITYFQDKGTWVEEKHPKVDIAIPDGIIKNSDLQSQIESAMYWDECANARTSIMQFANLLHLIYLNCQSRDL